jgi:hypothetical protein
MRREFKLPPEDEDYLVNSGLEWETVRDGGSGRVIIHGFPIPEGYNVRTASINVRIDGVYPESQLDMVYIYPPLSLVKGTSIGALSSDQFDGKTWQRWSRHRTPQQPWRPGIDDLSMHLELVKDWLARELKK